MFYDIWTDELTFSGAPYVLARVSASSPTEALLTYARNQGVVCSKKDVNRNNSLRLPSYWIYASKV